MRKAKPAERRGREATGTRFLREASDDFSKDSNTIGTPKLLAGIAEKKGGST
jgi:hypothetical protein